LNFDSQLHDAAGSQISPLHDAAGSQISPLHHAAAALCSRSQILPMHFAAGSQFFPHHFAAERCDSLLHPASDLIAEKRKQGVKSYRCMMQRGVNLAAGSQV
jgi:hypothetical protein